MLVASTGALSITGLGLLTPAPLPQHETRPELRTVQLKAPAASRLTTEGSAQAPAEHTSPAPQLKPHEPQLALSALTDLHMPPHSFWPGGQAQLPSVQTWPPWQAAPQPPQLVASVNVSTQVLLHTVRLPKH
jgi:hypothetical protein